jgi:hypothetical protein
MVVVPKEIDHKEHDICRECWSELQTRLKGRGRAKQRESIMLPPPPGGHGNGRRD